MSFEAGLRWVLPQQQCTAVALGVISSRLSTTYPDLARTLPTRSGAGLGWVLLLLLQSRWGGFQVFYPQSIPTWLELFQHGTDEGKRTVLIETGKLGIAHGSVEFCETTAFDLVDKPKQSLYGREADRDLRSACRCIAFYCKYIFMYVSFPRTTTTTESFPSYTALHPGCLPAGVDPNCGSD